MPACETHGVSAMSVKADSRRQAPCAHHWLCDPADSLTSKAVCRLCGAKGEFHNHLAQQRWRGGFKDLPLGPLSAPAGAPRYGRTANQDLG